MKKHESSECRDTRSLFWRVIGRGPPDSLIQLSCYCGFQGMMEMGRDPEVLEIVRFRYDVKCPICGAQIKIAGFKNPMKSINKNMRKAVALIILGLLAFCLAGVINYYPTAMLLKLGPRGVIEWIKKPKSDRDLYMIAWAHYTDNNIDLSRIAAEKLVLRPGLDRKTRADTFYLLGLLSSRDVPHLAYYHLAIQQYQILGTYNSEWLATVGLAEAYLSLGDTDKADSYIRSLDRIPASRPNHGYLYEVNGYLAFERADYPLSAELARSALEEYRGADVNGEARALSCLGLYLLASGENRDGWEATIEADRIIARVDLSRLWYFNQVNHAIYLKVNGLPHEGVVRTLEDRLANHPDARLKKQVAFVEQFSCQYPDRGGDGTSPPPPPDQ